jgi:hypothetical protein
MSSIIIEMVHPLELDLPIAKNKRPYHKSRLELVFIFAASSGVISSIVALTLGNSGR